MWPGVALLLGSWWALVPAVVIVVVFVIRTALEDKTLRAGLPGYTEYAQHTRYRLVPGVW
jgi:protein-S-isoprenylcysteine O-methyltransferase Ste14